MANLATIHLAEWIIYFLVLSVMGWLTEVIYIFLKQGRLVNSGFLFGPVVPIYAVGGVIITMAANLLGHNPLLVFMISVLAASVLEYFTHWLMEAAIGLALWDYSDEKFNLRGRIYLQGGVQFGLLALIVTHILNPPIWLTIQQLSDFLKIFLAATGLILLLVDFIFTLTLALKLRPILKLNPKLFKAWSRQRHRLDNRFSKRGKALEKQLTHLKKVYLKHIIHAFPNARTTKSAKKSK